MTIPPRFPITAAEIDRVTARFYAEIRMHPTLGPIFSAHVTDWPTHEAKISSFWRNAILFERNYNGNPMQAHMAAGNVKPDHFVPWLALFDQILSDELTAQTAAAWSTLAHRIGQGLRFGLDTYGTAPPSLRAV